MRLFITFVVFMLVSLSASAQVTDPPVKCSPFTAPGGFQRGWDGDTFWATWSCNGVQQYAFFNTYVFAQEVDDQIMSLVVSLRNGDLTALQKLSDMRTMNISDARFASAKVAADAVYALRSK